MVLKDKTYHGDTENSPGVFYRGLTRSNADKAERQNLTADSR